MTTTVSDRHLVEKRWAYTFFRAAMGIDFFGHGFIRIYHGTGAFAAWMVGAMSSAPLLPVWFVHAFGMVVPWVEITLGLLMLLGLYTRAALTGAVLLMFCLMTGVALKQDWSTISLQLHYVFFLAVLLFLRADYDSGWPALCSRRAGTQTR